MKELLRQIEDTLGGAPEGLRGRISETRILSDEEVSYLARGTRLMLERDGFPFRADGFEDNIRFNSVAVTLRRNRERLGLSIPEISRKLKTPQYRLKDIEGADPQKIRPEILRSYVDLLGVRSWLGRWAKQNAELAGRLGLVSEKEVHK